MKNPDGTTHPATFQADLCEQLTPATVAVWLRARGRELLARGKEGDAFALGTAARRVEELIDSAESR